MLYLWYMLNNQTNETMTTLATQIDNYTEQMEAIARFARHNNLKLETKEDMDVIMKGWINYSLNLHKNIQENIDEVTHVIKFILK